MEEMVKGEWNFTIHAKVARVWRACALLVVLLYVTDIQNPRQIETDNEVSYENLYSAVNRAHPRRTRNGAYVNVWKEKTGCLLCGFR